MNRTSGFLLGYTRAPSEGPLSKRPLPSCVPLVFVAPVCPYMHALRHIWQKNSDSCRSSLDLVPAFPKFVAPAFCDLVEAYADLS